jgi:hypothetical protein
MTSVRVIILAQGEQRRLPDLKIPKQLLKLPACNDFTILRRTLIQVGHICHLNRIGWPHDGDKPRRVPTVVCGDAIRTEIVADVNAMLRPQFFTLDDPGNSSLKGIHRYLTGIGQHDPVADHNVVLLGDVVYSWACLSVLLEPFAGSGSGIRFCGTSDMGAGGGELWGVSWNDIADDQMMTMLDSAVRKHPSFSTYQPGQMRRWLWQLPDSRGLLGKVNLVNDAYTAIDDYTRDIDLPEHVAWLFPLSERAAADDRENGVVW